MDGNIDKVREALIGSRFIIDKFTMGTHPALKKIDEALAALSAIDPEAIRRYRLAIEQASIDLECYASIHEADAKDIDAIIKGLDAAILSAEPAQADGKPEVEDDALKLEPCPHCGSHTSVALVSSKDEHYDEDDDPAEHGESYRVVCNFNAGGCGAGSGYRRSIDDAIALWNRRRIAEAKE